MASKRMTPVAAARLEASGVSSSSHDASISVVITSFNQAGFLHDAIRSVLGQSEPCTEIIVVDDGSTDNAAEVAGAYDLVRYVRQENRGPSAARNTGLRVSSGSFVVFLDADDILEPNALAIGKAHLLAHPDWAFVSGAHRRVAADLSPLGAEIRRSVHSSHYEHLLRSNFIEMHATVMYRREALEAINGFNESLRGAEDYDVYLQIARTNAVGSHCNVIAAYRQHDSNSSRNLNTMLATVLRVIESQRPWVAESAELQLAWREGRARWVMYYGNQIIKQFLGDPAARKAGRVSTSSLLTVLRQYPYARAVARYLPFSRSSVVRPVRRQLRKVKLFGMHRLLRLGSFSSDVVLGDASAQESVVSKYVERVLEEHRAEANGALRIEWDAELVKVLAALPSQSQSCVICLGFGALDAAAAVAEVHRVLRPRGIFLGVLPGVVMPFDVAAVNDYWRFTAEGARRLFAKHFGADVEAAHLGNSVTALAALHRLRADSLEESEFTPADSQHQLLVTVRAVRH